MHKTTLGVFLLLFSIFFASPSFAVSCITFNAAGTARSAHEFTTTKPTSEQISLFKNVLANHVKDFSRFSKRQKVIDLLIKNDRLIWFVGNSLSMTRDWCLIYPERTMNKVAAEQFNFLIDAVAEDI